VRLLDVPLTAALRFASTHPAQFLGLGDRLGRLLPGYRADMIALDPGRTEVAASWIAGVAQHA
jgi:N-acetylglucosamine-6-phosphate deacetylase